MGDSGRVVSCVTSFDFDSWASENGLSANTIAKLKDEEVVTAEILTALSRDDLKDLGLTVGQRTQLQQAIARLTTTPAIPGQASQQGQGSGQRTVVTEAAIQAIMDEVKRDGENLAILLRKAADNLDYHFTNVHRARVVASSAAILGRFLAIASSMASPLVAASMALQPQVAASYCNNAARVGHTTATAGHAISKGASVVGAMIEKKVLEEMQAQWLVFKEKFCRRSEMMRMLVNDESSTENGASNSPQALPMVVEMNAGNLMATERPSALTEVLQVLGKEVQGGLQVMTLDALGSGQLNGMIRVMVDEDIHDVIDASVKLSLEIKCPAGEPLRLLAEALELMCTLDLLSDRRP